MIGILPDFCQCGNFSEIWPKRRGAITQHLVSPQATNILCHLNSNPPDYHASFSPLRSIELTYPHTMHSKHQLNPRHTMSSTYRPRFCSPSTQPRLSTHHRPSSWSEHQAALILSLRDVTNPPTKTPDPDVRDFDVDRQIHARWTDPGIVDALVGAVPLRYVASGADALHCSLMWTRQKLIIQARLRDSLPPKTKLSFNYGGRDVTEATWVPVYQVVSPPCSPDSFLLCLSFPISSLGPTLTLLSPHLSLSIPCRSKPRLQCSLTRKH